MEGTSQTIRISWDNPIGEKRCKYCHKHLMFAHSTSGKKVHCLDGVYEQIINLYKCPNRDCKGAKEYVNPSPRLDYSGRYYGADVFRTVADLTLRVKAKTEQILLILEGMGVEISESTVRQMVNDVILLKSDAIDRKTYEMITKQDAIILSLDGQEPDNGDSSLWLFTDLISGRVLFTQLLDSASYMTIHLIIEKILEKYQTKLMGIVSDKQSNLTKCMKTYYPEVPHQLCTWHFANNIWKHLEMFDNRIHMALRKCIKESILYLAPENYPITVRLDGTKEDASTVFKETRKDMKRLIKEYSTKFEFLHGIDLYYKLTKFCDDLEAIFPDLPVGIQLVNILSNEIQKFRKVLEQVSEQSKESELAFANFTKMYSILYSKERKASEIEVDLSDQFDAWWKLAQDYGIKVDRAEVKSILPKASIKIGEYFAEATRLWDRYRGGLFQYQHFPVEIKTNVAIEQLFSKEVCYILGQSCKRRIGFLIETRGEYFLRILHATKEELQSDILESFSQERLEELRAELQGRITQKTSNWVRFSEISTSIGYLKRKYGLAECIIHM